jgi:hypothetical protein
MIAVASVFVAALLFPLDALAARSGGRVGGSSFRSSGAAAARSSTRSESTSRSATRLYSSPSTTINKTYIYGGGSHVGFGYHPFGFSPFGGYYSYFPIHNNNLYLGLSFADSIFRAIER